MATVATRTAIHLLHVKEVFEPAETILRRTRDQASVQKVTIVRRISETVMKALEVLKNTDRTTMWLILSLIATAVPLAAGIFLSIR